MRKHRVIFYSPGTLFAETTTKPIESWDPKLAVAMAETILERYGAKPYGFQFQTFLTQPPVPDGEGGILEVQPKIVDTSGTYFLGGEIESYDDVILKNRREPHSVDILLSNMKCNGWWHICTVTNGYKTTQPFTEKDVVVGASGNIVRRGDEPAMKKYRTYRSGQ